MFELVVEGPVNNSSETRQRIFRALHKELRLTREEAQGVLEALPHTLVVADSDEELALYYQVLSIAGAKVMLVCREQGSEEYFSEGENDEDADFAISSLDDESGPFSEGTASGKDRRESQRLELGQSWDGTGGSEPSSALQKAASIAVFVALVLMTSYVGNLYFFANNPQPAQIRTTAAPEVEIDDEEWSTVPVSVEPEQLSPENEIYRSTEHLGARIIEAMLRTTGSDSAVASLHWRPLREIESATPTSELRPESIRRLELSELSLAAAGHELSGEGVARVFVDGPTGSKRVIAKALLKATRVQDDYELRFSIQRGASLDGKVSDNLVRYVPEQDDFLIALSGTVTLRSPGPQ